MKYNTCDSALSVRTLWHCYECSLHKTKHEVGGQDASIAQDEVDCCVSLEDAC